MGPVSGSIGIIMLTIMYAGDIVFAISGAMNAARHRMDVLGFVLIGTITGIGGGTLRDIIMNRTVWWTKDPTELILCMTVALLTFFFIKTDITNRKWMIWSDTIGLACFSVVGCHTALAFGVSFPVAVFLGMITATGGGVIRDTLTQTQPMILCGQLYATAALAGSLGYALLSQTGLPEGLAELLAFLAAFSLRACAIIFDIRMGPPGEFITIGKSKKQNTSKGETS